MNAEQKRLDEAARRALDWKKWGPYVSDRAWGTVREDYSPDGSAWEYFPFEHAHLKAYRWNEDGIGGICDRKQNLCLAFAFWNGRDPILKERYFGVTGNQGNHGEDVKDYYFYLDSTPTHSYLKMLYKYPQDRFPYELLLEKARSRGKSQPEFELLETGVFERDRYFDIFIEYAKADVEDICVKVTAFNRADRSSALYILPFIWFRNTWTWRGEKEKPRIERAQADSESFVRFDLYKKDFGRYKLFCEGRPEMLFCENETNFKKLYNGTNASLYARDGINDYVVHGAKEAVNPENFGTRAAALYKFEPGPKQSCTVYLRLVADSVDLTPSDLAGECRKVFAAREAEAEEFYEDLTPPALGAEERRLFRQSLGGMLWSKQYYHYVVKEWLEGDPAFPPPPKSRLTGRNHEWTHLYNDEVVSMPDKWEYPWYAAWDLAFHAIPLALVDPDFAKRQLILLLREWYMHPNGQIPAYEWKFSDVNPPVHAWAALRVYRIEKKNTGFADRLFLERVFHKLLLNFTWWVNRKDAEGNNVFEGGFLGLDNIGLFDRSAELPDGGVLEQSDGTSWMAMYCLNMLAIAFELAREDKAYEDVASKFFEHFVHISDAMNNIGEEKTELWNEEDGFYYDVLHFHERRNIPLKIRSMVGLIPLFACETIEKDWLDDFPEFKKRTEWFMTHRPDLTDAIACLQEEGLENRRLLAVVGRERLKRILQYMLSEDEFLSGYGIRSLSKFHEREPFEFSFGGAHYEVSYEPGESLTGMFGGNSNWRGPIWFPLNYLIIESLQKFDYFYGDDFRLEFPTGSGRELNLWQISQELEKRLCAVFLPDERSRRPVYTGSEKFQTDPLWRDNILFYEYFHGETGRGLGASHQTGWTGLVAKLIQQIGLYAGRGAHADLSDLLIDGGRRPFLRTNK